MKICISSPRIEEPEEGQTQFELDNKDCNTEAVEFFQKFGHKSSLLGHNILVIDSIVPNIKFHTPVKIAVIEHGHIVYMCEYKIETLKQKTLFTQNFVWASKGWNKGFARQCLDYWLNVYDIVATSNVQRPLGVQMWKQFVHDNKGTLHLFYFDQSLHDITNMDQFNALVPKIWGTQKIFERIILLASKTPIDSTIFE